MEYTVIDCDTRLIYGPYETLAEARDRVEQYDLKTWEIIDTEGRTIEWMSIKSKT